MYRRIALTVALLLTAGTTVNAEGMSSLLNMYDVPNVVNTEEVYNKLRMLENETNELYTAVSDKKVQEVAYGEFERIYSTFLETTDDELIAVQNDLQQLETMMKYDHDLPIEDILKLDISYRTLRSEYDSLIAKRELLSQQFNSAPAVKVTSEELNLLKNKENELGKYKEVYMKRKNEFDLGEIRGRHPVNNTKFITSAYGWRKNPISGQGIEFHQGVDFRGTLGTEVIAKYNGSVYKTGTNAVSGNYVWLDHGGNIQTLYAHLSTIDVKQGQEVSQYQRIGTIGSTGRSSGPHLHFGLYINGDSVDPKKTLE